MRVPDERTGGPHFARFCERYIEHTNGRWARQPLILEDWQRDFVWEALEFDPATGLRVYQEVGLGIPTKNGKSTLASAAGLYFLVADEENEPEVIVGAATRTQATIVLGQARSMGQRSRRLAPYVQVQQHRILAPRSTGIMRAVAADGPLQHGFNPSCVILDEIHAHRNDGLYTALTKSGLAREQPFTLWITTGGPEGGLLGDLLDQMSSGPGELEVRNGGALRIYRDRANGVLIWWYGAPPGADIDDPAVWRACNPASWLQDGSVLTREYNRLKARGALLEWRMYHLNQAVGATEDAWMPVDAWQACSGDPVFRSDLRTYAAIRIAHDHRAAAVAIAQRQGERVALRVRSFPDEPLPEGEYLPASGIEDHLRGLRRRYPAEVAEVYRTSPSGRELIRGRPGPEFAYHGSFFERSAQGLREERLVLVDVPSTPERLTPAAETLMSLVTSRSLVHDGDAELAEQVRNVLARPVPKGWAIDAAVDLRTNERRRIVAAQAAMLAVHRAMTAQRPPSRAVHYGPPLSYGPPR
jgi:phage terminase large subunit-like protein